MCKIPDRSLKMSHCEYLIMVVLIDTFHVTAYFCSALGLLFIKTQYLSAVLFFQNL